MDVIIEDDRWAEIALDDLAARAVAQTLTHLGLEPGAWEIALLATSDARIMALNTEFRGKGTATNVLSWPSVERSSPTPGKPPPMPTGDPELGDLALAFETCAKEAELAGMPLDSHATHLIIHGTLHLLGYDHENDADADLMEAVETAILASLGVPDPYVR